MLHERVVYQSLKELVVQRIRKAILDGELELGTRLVETTVAEELGVSRGPVREAFLDLAREGLLEIHPRRGASVTTLAPDDIWQIYALRGQLEALLIRYGLPCMTEADIRYLEELVAQMGAVTEGPGAVARATELDLSFHGHIAQCCPYPRIVEAYRSLDAQVGAGIYTVIRVVSGTIGAMQAKHMPLLAAIQSRDVARAEQATHSHWMVTAERIRSLGK